MDKARTCPSCGSLCTNEEYTGAYCPNCGWCGDSH